MLWFAAALLPVAGIGWAVLLVPVLRHWKTPTAGISFVAGIATDGLALLSAALLSAALLALAGLVRHLRLTWPPRAGSPPTAVRIATGGRGQ